MEIDALVQLTRSANLGRIHKELNRLKPIDATAYAVLVKFFKRVKSNKPSK